MAYMTFVQFCVCYACWFAALARLPASTASIGSLLMPVVGVLASAAALGEPLGLREVLALTLTLGGVVLAARIVRQKPAPCGAGFNSTHATECNLTGTDTGGRRCRGTCRCACRTTDSAARQ